MWTGQEDEKMTAIMMDALRDMQMIASLKLPKKTRIIGTKHGHEIHRPDGISYLVRVIEPRQS